MGEDKGIVNVMNVSTEGAESYTKAAMRVEIIGITTNILLFIFKLLAGILGKSGAMISDAIHTASDVFADLIAITGLQLSKKEEDREHPFGSWVRSWIRCCYRNIKIHIRQSRCRTSARHHRNSSSCSFNSIEGDFVPIRNRKIKEVEFSYT